MKKYIYVVILILFIMLTTSDLFSATFDLTGNWEYKTSNNWAEGGYKCDPGSDASGTCKISQNGDTFAFAFTSGYICDPPESCTFEGAIDGSVYTCSTTDTVDDEGGVVTSTLVITAESANSASGTGVARYTHPSELWECTWGFDIVLTRAVSATADIKVNDSDGTVNIKYPNPAIVKISLSPGATESGMADWWIVVNTSLSPPSDWYSYVYPTGWQSGIHRCIKTGILSLKSYEVLNMNLPKGQYTFYFALDDPDGKATGPWWSIDSVKVSVK